MFTCGPALIAGSAGSGGDPYFAQTVLLLHFDGTNGQGSTTDSSPRAHAMSTLGPLSLSTASAKFGTSSSIMGGAKSWYTPDHASWAFGSGQFTIEAFIRFTAAHDGTTRSIISQWTGSSDISFLFYINTTGGLAFSYSSNGSSSAGSISTAWSPSLNTWYHIAIDRDASSVMRLYIDGVVKSSATVTTAFRDSSLVLDVAGSFNGFAGPFGYLDEVRITKGVARYAGAFTPPTAAFPNS